MNFIDEIFIDVHKISWEYAHRSLWTCI